MVQLMLSEDGTITLTQDLMDHMGVGPGDELEYELLAAGQIVVSPARERHVVAERD